eukprot:6957542-Prymnesium_polylepis.1
METCVSGFRHPLLLVCRDRGLAAAGVDMVTKRHAMLLFWLACEGRASLVAHHHMRPAAAGRGSADAAFEAA